MNARDLIKEVVEGADPRKVLTEEAYSIGDEYTLGWGDRGTPRAQLKGDDMLPLMRGVHDISKLDFESMGRSIGPGPSSSGWNRFEVWLFQNWGPTGRLTKEKKGKVTAIWKNVSSTEPSPAAKRQLAKTGISSTDRVSKKGTWYVILAGSKFYLAS